MSLSSVFQHSSHPPQYSAAREISKKCNHPIQQQSTSSINKQQHATSQQQELAATTIAHAPNEFFGYSLLLLQDWGGVLTNKN
jgi:hypothetical protein